MPERLTIKKVEEIFKERELTLESPTKYKNKKTPMDCFDKYGYKYSLSCGNVQDKRTLNFEKIGKYNPYFCHNLQLFIKLNGGNAELITSHYVKSDDKLELKCGECGEIYSLSVHHLLGQKKFTCNKCSLDRMSDKSRTKVEDIEDMAKKCGYKLIGYVNTTSISIQDKECYKYKTSYFNLKNRKDTSSKFSKKNPYTISNMCNYLKINKIPVELVDKTERQVNVRNDYLAFSCSECGDTYMATWGQVAYESNRLGRRIRCHKCSGKKSNLEFCVEKYLKSKNIKYTREKRFDGCRNKNTLPFDFYLIDFNAIIEVNGHQHYYKNELFERSLEENQRIDKIKKDFCISNGMKYVAIPYWKIYNSGEEKESYKDIINNILNQK